jgi:hypothetical protein
MQKPGLMSETTQMQLPSTIPSIQLHSCIPNSSRHEYVRSNGLGHGSCGPGGRLHDLLSAWLMLPEPAGSAKPLQIVGHL